MADNKTLALIDGHALAYKMFFALNKENFSTRQGEPTNATWGFTRTVFDLINSKNPPEYLAVSFDTGATFRDAMFAEYKGTRDKMPDDLQRQIDRIHQVLDALKIAVLEVEGFEADDVLGTVARKAGTLGLRTLIITGDRDLLQLVDEHTTVELPGNRAGEAQVFDPSAVREKYGLDPIQIVDYKALVGDQSDNIPGVAGIGEKTATKLLQNYKTLENLYAHLDELTEKRARSALEAGRDSAFLSYKLAQIVTDVPLDFDPEACRIGQYDSDKVIPLFRELEFRSFLKRIAGTAEEPEESGAQQLSLFGGGAAVSAPITESSPTTQTRIVQDEAALDDLAHKLESASMIAFDTETTSTDQMQARLVGISLAVQAGEGYYIPVGHAIPGAVQLPLDVVLDRLRAAMTDPAIPKVGHNAKYDAVVLAEHGLDPTPIRFDTMIGEWLVRSDSSRGKLGLKNLAFSRLGIQMTDYEDVVGRGKKQISFDQAELGRAAPYAAADADMTLRLVEPIRDDLEQQGLMPLMEETEIPLLPVLAAMERTGVLIDIEFLRRMSAEVSVPLAELRDRICQIVGYDFNLNSTQQLSRALFEKLRLPTQGMRKTASGFYSTAADVLESLKAQDTTGVVEALLQYRELEKLRSTYLDALPALVNPHTGRVHTSYNQTGAVTGRISSSDPNLQNIPIRTDLGKQVRHAFIAAPGNALVVADYSQIELRVMAHFSGDEALRQAFVEDQDIHATTAAAVFNVPLDQVTRGQRSFAKAVNFGLMYGMSAYGLADRSELTLAEAEEFMKGYFERFPKVKIYLDDLKQRAAEQGYLETLLKRRRYFPALQSRDNSPQVERDRRTEREAINYPIQGSAADIIKLAMIRLHAALAEKNLRGAMILQVHDELVLEAPEKEVEKTAALVKEVMENAFPLNVPLRADVSIAANWGEAK